MDKREAEALPDNKFVGVREKAIHYTVAVIIKNSYDQNGAADYSHEN
jgi:hypothetical protein